MDIIHQDDRKGPFWGIPDAWNAWAMMDADGIRTGSFQEVKFGDIQV